MNETVNERSRTIKTNIHLKIDKIDFICSRNIIRNSVQFQHNAKTEAEKQHNRKELKFINDNNSQIEK